MEPLLASFFTVSTCRSFGMAVGPIPYTAVLAWMAENGVGEDLRGLWFTLIQMMDRAYLAWHDRMKAPPPDPGDDGDNRRGSHIPQKFQR